MKRRSSQQSVDSHRPASPYSAGVWQFPPSPYLGVNWWNRDYCLSSTECSPLLMKSTHDKQLGERSIRFNSDKIAECILLTLLPNKQSHDIVQLPRQPQIPHERVKVARSKFADVENERFTTLYITPLQCKTLSSHYSRNGL